MNGAELIAAERERQESLGRRGEGYSAEHDDQHTNRELARAAALYADPPGITVSGPVPNHWPWGPESWKPDANDPIHNLVRAGALIAAEIDRLKRAALDTGGSDV